MVYVSYFVTIIKKIVAIIGYLTIQIGDSHMENKYVYKA